MLNQKGRNQKGGYLLDLIFKKKVVRPTKNKKKSKPVSESESRNIRPKKTKKHATVYEKAVDSEADLIKSYEALAKTSKAYYEDYSDHLNNLITLDDINGMTGLQTTFKNVLIKDAFKGYDKINTDNPLLLRNYLITEHTQPKYFRKMHLMQQVRYKLATDFAIKDAILISEYDIRMENNKAVIKYKMINGDVHERSVDIDSDFNMDLTKLAADLRDIIASMKKNMGYEIDIDDNFELQDIAVEVPGLQFAKEEDTLARKLRELKTSIKPDEAILNNIGTAGSKKSSVKKPPPNYREGLLQIASLKKSAAKKPRVEGEADKLAFGEGKLEGIAPTAEELAKELNKIAEQGATRVVSEKKKSSNKRASNKKKYPSYKPDDIDSMCWKLTGKEEECKANKLCFFNKYTLKCKKNTAVIPKPAT